MGASSPDVTTGTPPPAVDYPSSDGQPMGETDLHRSVMVEAIETLKMYYAGRQVYVSGNILLYYRPGNRRRHVSPDVLVVRGLEPRNRDCYLVWEEGLAPNVVIEVTSPSTREEDLTDKLEIYQDELAVAEYFLFDPRSEYLDPALQGYRLNCGRYEPVPPVDGRLPSEELGLALEADGSRLRFYDSTAHRWLPTPEEARLEEHAIRCRLEAELQRSEAARQRAEAELERLRRELAQLKREA